MRRQTYKVHGLDCAEEVTILKNAVGPLIGGPDQLSFDVLNGRMTVAGDASAAIVIDAVRRTGMRAEPWTPEAKEVAPHGPGRGFFDRHVTIVQDTTIFSDFHDYFDRYLQPELSGKGPVRLTHSTLHVHFISADSTRAYAVSNYTLIVGTERATGVDTLVLVRDSTGEWTIRHAHVTRSKDVDGKR